MQGTLSELRDIAVSQDLVERLTMAYVKVAKQIYQEADNGSIQQKAAVQLLLNPRSLAERMRYAVVVIANSDSDADLTTAANISFLVYAKTFTEEVVG
jgi:hypothetical protein